MINIHPKYIVDNKKETKAVVIPLNEWNIILSEIEELEDIRAYDEAIPFSQAVNEIMAKNEKRIFTQCI